MNIETEGEADRYRRQARERAQAHRTEQSKLAFDNAIRAAVQRAIDAGLSKEHQHSVLSDWAERSGQWLREERMRAAQQ